MKEEKFKIGIIDEYQDDIDDFKIFFENDFEIIVIGLASEIEKLVNKIIYSEVDAVAIDYKLTEHNPEIGFTGDNVYNLLINRYYKFPAFILTNYVPDAIYSSAEDNFNIISKRWLKTGTEEGKELIAKIKASIVKYKQFIKNSEKEILQLIDKKNKNQLTVEEEERLIELDSILENIIDKSNNIPKQLKEQKSEVSKLIELAEEILKKNNKKI